MAFLGGPGLLHTVGMNLDAFRGLGDQRDRDRHGLGVRERDHRISIVEDEDVERLESYDGGGRTAAGVVAVSMFVVRRLVVPFAVEWARRDLG